MTLPIKNHQATLGLDSIEMPKNTILTEAGRAPWFRLPDGKSDKAYIIGIAGGSASGKSRVSQAILERLGVPWVLVVAQDNFYKAVPQHLHHLAFKNEYDFDCPEAYDFDELKRVLRDLKDSKAVQIPNYSFVHHQRMAERTYLYGASVIILEGILALHDPEVRELLDLKIFVQCDSDLMLARRLKRDVVERGRDSSGIIDQYLRFVKPAFDNFVQPSSKNADLIVPGMNNETSMDLISSHIRSELERRRLGIRNDLFTSVLEGEYPRDAQYTQTLDGNVIVPDNVHLVPQTNQIRGIHTILRNNDTPLDQFIFYADRLSTLIIEHALPLLPFKAKEITTGTGLPYTGQILDAPYVCGVSILRSGASLEKGLRRVLRDIPIGSVLIQSDSQTGEPFLYQVSLPTSVKSNPSSSFVFLLDSQIGTGAAALMAIRVLLDHGVKEEQIVFCCFLVSRVGGIWAVREAFPGVRIVTSAIDGGLREQWIPFLQEEGSTSSPGEMDTYLKKRVFCILPGLGSFGKRYYGA